VQLHIWKHVCLTSFVRVEPLYAAQNCYLSFQTRMCENAISSNDDLSAVAFLVFL
jgi:hypothetical protein